jgi:hypothetical protein
MTQLASDIAGYTGTLLNHLEMLYRPGERDLAVSFCNMLGWHVIETDTKTEVGSTYMIVQFEPADSSYLDNVMFLSEMRPEHVDLEKVVAALRHSDSELAQAFDKYSTKAKTRPHGIPHFGVRYRTFGDLEAVLDRLEGSLTPTLRSRVAVDAIRPGDPRAMVDDLIQAFVYTDVICTGLFELGQLIELQGQSRV